MRGILSLALLVLGVGANNKQHAPALDDFAISAASFD
jgi:hypothetical protein